MRKHNTVNTKHYLNTFTAVSCTGILPGGPAMSPIELDFELTTFETEIEENY
jgi:hypothetical protein